MSKQDQLTVNAKELCDLLGRIHSVKADEKFAFARQVKRLTSDVVLLVTARFAPAPVESPLNDLSPRQREVLCLMAGGKSTKQIAIACGISAKTAESHRRDLMLKLNAESTADLTRYAIRNGLIEA